MTITSAIVLFAVIWAVTFFLVLPWGQVSQYEAGDVVPGTPASAPSDAMIRRKLIVTTGIAVVAFAVVFSAIYFRWVTIDDLTFMTPPSAR
jgi:predicted secreted protein